MKVARLYLEDDDPVNAEAFINRASHLQADTKDEKLQIYYKVGSSLLTDICSGCNNNMIISTLYHLYVDTRLTKWDHRSENKTITKMTKKTRAIRFIK